MFIVLTPQEEKEFRGWVADNHPTPTPINSIYHPVVKDEICNFMINFYTQQKEELQTLVKQFTE